MHNLAPHNGAPPSPCFTQDPLLCMGINKKDQRRGPRISVSLNSDHWCFEKNILIAEALALLDNPPPTDVLTLGNPA